MNASIESIAKCLKISEGTASDIIESEEIDLANITFNRVLDLIEKYKPRKPVELPWTDWTKKPVVINKPRKKETLRVMADIAFKPLYQKVLNNYGGVCAKCGIDVIHMHHKDFDHSNMTEENLIPLCPTCHFKEHRERFKKSK